MKLEPRTIAIIAVVIAVIGGIALAKSRGDDNLLQSPSSANGGPGAAAVEDVESARPSPSESPTDDADESDAEADTEDEGDESSDDASDDSSDDEEND